MHLNFCHRPDTRATVSSPPNAPSRHTKALLQIISARPDISVAFIPHFLALASPRSLFPQGWLRRQAAVEFRSSKPVDRFQVFFGLLRAHQQPSTYPGSPLTSIMTTVVQHSNLIPSAFDFYHPSQFASAPNASRKEGMNPHYYGAPAPTTTVSENPRPTPTGPFTFNAGTSQQSYVALANASSPTFPTSIAPRAPPLFPSSPTSQTSLRQVPAFPQTGSPETVTRYVPDGVNL